MKRLISKGWLIRLSLYCAIALVPACGSRKAAVDIQKDKTEQSTKEESKGQVTKETGQSEETKTTDKSTDTNEQQNSYTREVFNENGTLKERITELLNSKRVIQNDITINRTFRAYVFTDSTFHVTRTQKQVVTHYTKQKTTNRNSSIWLVVVGVLSFGLGLWISPKVARWFK